MKNNQIEFSTSDYRWTWGREPKGRGMWMFFFEGYEFSFCGTYAEAKKACINRVKELAPENYDGYVVVKVGT